MCLILTAAAAVITTIIWYFKFNDRKYKLGTLALMYWGASIMWSVDGIFSVIDGEGFFNMSADDALLGVIIIVCGIAAWLALLLADNIKSKKKEISGK